MSEIVEKSVIGAILIDPKCVSEIYEQIRLEMFGSSFCRSVYAEILKAYDAGKQITLISIAQKLQGESFSQERIMQELKGILPDIQAYKIKSYADALVAEYKTRRLKEMLSKIIPAAGIVDEQINTMLQELEAMKENDTVKIHALSEIVDSISDGYFKEPDTEPLYTGLEKLDNTLGGLEGGDMIVIGARPAVGKSAFVTQAVMRYKRFVRQYEQECGCEPSELACRAFLGVSEEELMDIRESANKANVSSLDSVVSQDNDKIVLRDLIASDQNLEEDAIKKRDREMMQEELNYIIDNLPDEQRRVIQEHYFERRTMKQIGERMGCSGAKAGDIERKALRKLRLPHVNRKYKEYHEQYLTPYPIMHIGIDSFQRTGYSEVERAVLGW